MGCRWAPFHLCGWPSTPVRQLSPIPNISGVAQSPPGVRYSPTWSCIRHGVVSVLSSQCMHRDASPNRGCGPFFERGIEGTSRPPAVRHLNYFAFTFSAAPSNHCFLIVCTLCATHTFSLDRASRPAGQSLLTFLAVDEPGLIISRRGDRTVCAVPQYTPVLVFS
jgi:hypothetical protein